MKIIILAEVPDDMGPEDIQTNLDQAALYDETGEHVGYLAIVAITIAANA